jgi:hypothetical protein
MMGETRKRWRGVMTAFLVASLLLPSGCALFLVGAGGAAGYMIKKGEEGDSPKKKGSSRLEEKSPSTAKAEYLVAYAPKREAVEELGVRPGDTP